MGWMGAALLAVASFGLGEAAQDQAPALSRLRTQSAAIGAAIDAGTERSPAFRDLLTRLSLTDGIVYVEEGVCGRGVRACLKPLVTIAGPYRLLFIQVDLKKLAGCVLVGAIGHELQHAAEVLSDSSVREGIGILSLYQRIGPTASGRFETEAAVHAGLLVERDACNRGVRYDRSMASDVSHDVTELLLAWRNGNPSALDALLPLVHAELVARARGYMSRERPGHQLQSHALVNEAYLRLIDVSRVDWQNRAHFFAVAATLMRRILVDVARAERGAKRGGNVPRVSLDDAVPPVPAPAYDVIGVHDALDGLARLDPRRAQVVELRIFGGLTIQETAAVVGVSTDTVKRDWALAKAWLARELANGEAVGEG